MKALFLTLACCCALTALSAQELYFPPTQSSAWDTLSPDTLNWCPEQIDALYDYLEAEQTKSFLVLKDGKIVLEKYFGTFTRDSLWTWFSAGKSLRAALVGIAQQEGVLDIRDKTSEYLGQGWTSLPPEREDSITLYHQLTMTTGLDESEFACISPDCLTYVADAGTRWAYHNGPYNLLKEVLEQATGLNHNFYTRSRVRDPIGMQTGFWLNIGTNDFFLSRARDMARFGLLMQNRGSWDGVPILSDTAYLNAMLRPSQALNPSYGYLWWLNGQESHILPEAPTSIDGPISPSAPEDVYLAAGGAGQFISISPSQGLVMVRQGLSGNTSLAAIALHDQIWERLSSLECTSSASSAAPAATPSVFPNPVQERLYLRGVKTPFSCQLFDSQGRLQGSWENQTEWGTASLPAGLYLLRIQTEHRLYALRVAVKR